MNYVFQFGEVTRYWPWLLAGVGWTVLFSAIGIVISLVVGFAGALGLRSSNLLLRVPALLYVQAIRNTPFFVQLLILFFGLASVGFRLNAVTAGLIGLVLYNGAFMTEMIRSGLDAVHRSQIEAGLSIGMSRTQVFFHVEMFPAIEKVYPALSSQFVLLMLSTSVMSTIGVDELTSLAARIQTLNFRSIEVYLVVILIYMALTLILRALARRVGKMLFRSQNAVAREAVR
jgi:polar amino acid transport system permease protein